jgi:hypothetical protein
MAFDVELGADGMWPKEALQPGQSLDNCSRHGVATMNRASSTTISAETVSAMSEPMRELDKNSLVWS